MYFNRLNISLPEYIRLLENLITDYVYLFCIYIYIYVYYIYSVLFVRLMERLNRYLSSSSSSNLFIGLVDQLEAGGLPHGKTQAINRM